MVVRISSRYSFGGEVVNRDVMTHRQFHCFLLVSAAHIERNSFVKFSLLLKVSGRLNHNWFASLQAHSHNFLVIAAIFSESNGMMQPLGL